MVLAGLWARRQVHWRESFGRVVQSKSGMIALVILIAYTLIGFLDSIHFKIMPSQRTDDSYAVTQNMQSLLDVILWPLGTQDEQTYSAPFAIYSSAKITVEENGAVKTYFPRLKFAGINVPSSQHVWDVTKKSITAIVAGLFLSILFCVLMSFILSKKQAVSFKLMSGKILRAKTSLAWKEVFITASFIIMIASYIKLLSPYYHLLGTDKIGDDILLQTIKSIRTGLIIGTLTTLIMLPFAILLGTLAGYFGGWRDDIIQYTYTTLSSIPAVLLISAAILSLQVFIANNPQLFPTLESQADTRLLALCMILGITSWTSLCRLLRAETLKLRQMDYVKAAVAMGVSHFKVIFRHILPNAFHVILITVVLDFSALVLAEAVLSYVGVGVDPITPSWGNMINSARLDLAREPIVWWPLFAAFLFMFVLVLSANIFADTIRDAFDPRSRD